MIYISAFVFLVTSLAKAENMTVGGDVGDKNHVEGISSPTIKLQDCHFKMSLLSNEHLFFNDPDMIFYKYDNKLSKKNRPYLWQANTSSAYYWEFKKKFNLQEKWFGLMCGVVEDFSWKNKIITYSNQEPITVITVRMDNDKRCPATKTDNKWTPNKKELKSSKYIFDELKGSNWDGFLIGYKGSGKNLKSIRFCLVHENKVLIGGATNTSKPLKLHLSTYAEIKQTLKTLTFIDENKATH